jgi:hypothetical protein
VVLAFLLAAPRSPCQGKSDHHEQKGRLASFGKKQGTPSWFISSLSSVLVWNTGISELERTNSEYVLAATAGGGWWWCC